MLVLSLFYFVASLAHFAHNAEFIAYYPGMPGWLTREHVYLFWLGITAVGALGWSLRHRRPRFAVLLLGVYGAFGLDGLAHYTLALCSEHTWSANFTIWAEAGTGLALLLCSAVWLTRNWRRPATKA